VKPIVIISTYPDQKSITKTANMLVERQIVACVNIIKIRSVYSWKKKTVNASEYLAIFKTTRQNIKKLKDEIRKTHPYKVPEIAEITISSLNKSYLKWLIDSTN